MKDILENYKEITRKFLDNPNEITLKAFLDFLFLDMKTYIGKMASFETGIQATIEGVVKTYTEYCKLRGISVLKHDFEKRMPRTGEDNPGRTDHTVEVEVHVPNDAQTKILKKLVIIELKYTQHIELKNPNDENELKKSKLKKPEKSRVDGTILTTIQQLLDHSMKQVNAYYSQEHKIIDRYVAVFVGRRAIVQKGESTYD